ncbi:MAG: sigma-54-dependent transcriptional regulator [Terasakiella sp.]|uniref:sigma-54-dependent transcriptional regulator n=1 Tax=unclassified Terasakiella TaxID=2614952 RepID=UPI003B00FAA8
MQKTTILIVDDEVRSLESLERILEDDFNILTAENTIEAEKILQTEWVQIILCDQRLPGLTGVEFLKLVRHKWPNIVRMIISGYTDSQDIISALNDAGIYQYITKPWQPESLIHLLKNAAQLFDLQRLNESLSIELKMAPDAFKDRIERKREKLKQNYQSDDGITRSEQSVMNDICAKIRRVAPYDISVLITGESGTGKELAARALHYNSHRANKAFVIENCAALPDQLLESELFGYKSGAFTGAVEDRIGLFERANGGTIFLDEIGEVSPAFQVKLLRVLQEGEIRPLGASKTRQVDVRVIAATNRDLAADVKSGRFREDLYYRLTPISIHLPPLRERIEDIPSLVQKLLHQATINLGKKVDGISDEALTCMQAYHWPGNVRELQNEIQHLLVMSDGNILGANNLSARILRAAPRDEELEIQSLSKLNGNLKDRVESIESRILKECLIRHQWNKSRAAKELGLSRVGLRSKLERYGLSKNDQIQTG